MPIPTKSRFRFSVTSTLQATSRLACQIFNLSMFSKNKKKITGEMVHVMHYYGVQNVPSFEELARKHRTKNEEKLVTLKFLIDTPAGGMRGFNMLMPVRSSEVQEATT